LDTHGAHALALHDSPVGHGAHVCVTPHPRSIGVQPVTIPASIASAHVWGLQHAFALHTSPPSQGAHTDDTPHPRLTDSHPIAPPSGPPVAIASAHVEGVQHAPE
jgi:hypothetical protein